MWTMLVAQLAWGVLYALWLQATEIGDYLCREETWVTVVIGVAGVGLIYGATGMLTWVQVGELAAGFGAAAIGIVGRSLINNTRRYHERWQALRGDRDNGRES